MFQIVYSLILMGDIELQHNDLHLENIIIKHIQPLKNLTIILIT